MDTPEKKPQKSDGPARPEARPLRIKGIGEAPLTPAPDDAELAAQALLETLCGASGRTEADRGRPAEGTREYYEELAARIRRAHEAERMAAARATAYCEERLRQERLPSEGDGSPASLGRMLLGHLDAVEREGGELKRRWQHCLAEVTVRGMDGPA